MSSIDTCINTLRILVYCENWEEERAIVVYISASDMNQMILWLFFVCQEIYASSSHRKIYLNQMIGYHLFYVVGTNLLQLSTPLLSW